jgi:iron-sulfur cluster assembly accessory protein
MIVLYCFPIASNFDLTVDFYFVGKGVDDFDLDIQGIKFVVDSMSAQYLQGADIDYVEDIHGSSFTIKNPNAQTTCGCGSSFSV